MSSETEKLVPVGSNSLLVQDDGSPCPCCGHVPNTHRKRQVRHLHCKSEGMVKFISELQGVLGVVGGFNRMIAAVKILQENVESTHR